MIKYYYTDDTDYFLNNIHLDYELTYAQWVLLIAKRSLYENTGKTEFDEQEMTKSIKTIRKLLPDISNMFEEITWGEICTLMNYQIGILFNGRNKTLN